MNKKVSSGVVHKLPTDLKDALVSEPTALMAWEDISPLARNEWICWVTSAKQEATRERRVKVGIDKLLSGMRRPCCWAGCTHRVK